MVDVVKADQEYVDMVERRLSLFYLFEEIGRRCVIRRFLGRFNESVRQDFLVARTEQEAAVGNVGDSETGVLGYRLGCHNLRTSGCAYYRGHDRHGEAHKQTE
jgi:hypothetical protein